MFGTYLGRNSANLKPAGKNSLFTESKTLYKEQEKEKKIIVNSQKMFKHDYFMFQIYVLKESVIKIENIINRAIISDKE